MQPADIVLGCMLDALVCNDAVDEALELPRSGSRRCRRARPHPPAAARHGALRGMRAEDNKMTTVAFAALFDAQARVGA